MFGGAGAIALIGGDGSEAALAVRRPASDDEHEARPLRGPIADAGVVEVACEAAHLHPAAVGAGAIVGAELDGDGARSRLVEPHAEPAELPPTGAGSP